jgi:hypothetical protein
MFKPPDNAPKGWPPRVPRPGHSRQTLQAIAGARPGRRGVGAGYPVRRRSVVMIWYLRSRAIVRLNFRGNTCIYCTPDIQFVISERKYRNARLGWLL